MSVRSLHPRYALSQCVTRTAHGSDRVTMCPCLERFSQTAHMYIDRAAINIDIAAPDAVEQLFTAPHPAWALHECGQKPELGRPKAQLFTLAIDAMLGQIDHDIVIVEPLTHCCGTHAAQLGAQACL